MTAANPTTFVIGAGPVATALAGALRLGGVPVLGLWARRPAQARAAGATAGVAAFSSAPPDLLLETQVVILAVRDQAIGEVATMLAGTGLIGKRHVMLHCGGAASARERLGAVAEQVGGVGTLLPLSAISSTGIRAAFASGAPASIANQVPRSVYSYIVQHNLYQGAPA